MSNSTDCRVEINGSRIVYVITQNGNGADIVGDGGMIWMMIPFSKNCPDAAQTGTYGRRGGGLCPAVEYSGLIVK